MKTPFLVVDAFTAEPFRGNPAAVCWLDAPRDDAWRRAVAAEMNLSETAFVEPRADGFGLRWFTPTVEVPLCGHATLASAHLLYATGRLARSEPARFHTKSGLLVARDHDGWIALDFPAFAPKPATPPPALVEAVCGGASGSSGLGSQGARPIATHRVDRPGTEPVWLFLLEDEAAVRAVAPRFPAMLDCVPDPVIVTARAATPGVDFVSRFFAPGHGIDEDPVTGSAHCMLGPYWRERLGRDALVGEQVSKRGGIVRVEVRGDRAELRGQAVTVSEGVLFA